MCWGLVALVLLLRYLGTLVKFGEYFVVVRLNFEGLPEADGCF